MKFLPIEDCYAMEDVDGTIFYIPISFWERMIRFKSKV